MPNRGFCGYEMPNRNRGRRWGLQERGCSFQQVWHRLNAKSLIRFILSSLPQGQLLV
jgi:hypothetical protein